MSRKSNERPWPRPNAGVLRRPSRRFREQFPENLTLLFVDSGFTHTRVRLTPHSAAGLRFASRVAEAGRYVVLIDEGEIDEKRSGRVD